MAAVVLSGCIGGGGGTGGTAGVVIDYFEPDISEIYSSEEVMFTAGVKNIGEENAENVELRLFGLGNDWTWDSGKTQQISGRLEKSDESEGIEGGTGEAQWVVTSPSGLKVDNTYTANVRLSYDYETTARANVKVYDTDYLRSISEEASDIMQSSGIETFTVTDAPISIELTGLSKPLIYRESGQKSSVTVLINNVGDGKPYLDNENDLSVRVGKVTVDGEVISDVSNKDYRLPRSGKKSLPVQFELPDIESYTTIPIEIELTYRYFVDSSTNIIVLKTLFDDDTSQGTRDRDAPEISDIELEKVSDTSVKVTWKTDEDSGTAVQYSRTSECVNPTPATSSGMDKDHEVTIEDLDTGVTYYYFVESTDSDGNKATSDCDEFIIGRDAGIIQD